MTKISGWDRVYMGKREDGAHMYAPSVMVWDSIYGEEVAVEANHTWHNDEVVYYDKEEIPEGEDKWVVRINSERHYFPTRTDATEFAREYMRSQIDEEEAASARTQLRHEQDTE